MKISFLPFLILGLCLGTACQQDPLAQDPYAKKSKEVQNGQPPGPIEKPSPELGDLKIESSSPFYQFKEGIGSTAVFVPRVNIKNVKYRLGVQNMEDFPGASFNEQTGIFSWNPPVGVTGRDLEVTKNLVMELITEATKERPASGVELAVPIQVFKKYSVPTVVSLENYRTEYKEGSYNRFSVIVNDIDADNINGRLPRIEFVAENKESEKLLNYLEVYSRSVTQDPTNPTLWKFDISLALSDANLTSSATEYLFRIKVSSQYNEQSVSVPIRLLILNELVAPTLSMGYNEFIYMKIGKSYHYSFVAMDPRGEGQLKVTSVVAPSASKVQINCVETTPSMSSCQMDIQATKVEDFKVTVTATTELGGEKKVSEREMTINIQERVPLSISSHLPVEASK